MKERKIMVRVQDIWDDAEILGRGRHIEEEDFDYYLVKIYEKENKTKSRLRQ